MALTEIITYDGAEGVAEMARGGGTVLESVSSQQNAVEIPSGGGAGAVFPTAGDVDQGVSYGPTGADYTGTLEQPAASDVRNGVGYGAAGTEFTGTVVLPSPGDVDQGVGYGAGGTESTGTLLQPAEADVELGVSYGANGTEFTGTLTGGGGTTVVNYPRMRR